MGRLALMKYLKPTAGLNSEYYPDSVRQILVVNCPGMITWLYSFVKPLIPETTQKKVVFVSTNGHAELLAWTGDERQIPREYGGQGPPCRDIVRAFTDELRTHLAAQPGYDEAPDAGAADPAARARLRDLAAKESK